jgi:hypothetical protein
MSAPIQAIGIDADEILAEHALGESLTTDVLAALIRKGVNVTAIHRRVQQGALDGLRLDRVIYVDDRHFEFPQHHSGDDAGAMTFICRDHLGDPIDIAAWSPHVPILASWLGRAALLGEQNLFTPRMSDGLRVYPTPLEWLQHACCGVVVIEPTKAAPLLRRAEPLQAASIEHGRELRRMLEVRRPRIFVPTSSDRRAA